MRIALGSARAAKIMAVHTSVARIATVDAAWSKMEIVAREVATGVTAMPMDDEELIRGARGRARAVRELLTKEREGAHLYAGLEGGFHTVVFDGRRQTFLRGWAYVTDGEREGFGASPSVAVPERIVARVVAEGRELGEVIDEVAGEYDVRSRQGAWGVLSRDLLTRAMSFEAALIAAFAPFYNGRLYS